MRSCVLRCLTLSISDFVWVFSLIIFCIWALSSANSLSLEWSSFLSAGKTPPLTPWGAHFLHTYTELALVFIILRVASLRDPDSAHQRCTERRQNPQSITWPLMVEGWSHMGHLSLWGSPGGWTPVDISIRFDKNAKKIKELFTNTSANTFTCFILFSIQQKFKNGIDFFRQKNSNIIMLNTY